MQKLNPEENIIGAGGLTIGDFWSWAYSDILSNRNRSVFAEYLVGSALGVTDKPRREWDAVDLRLRGKTVEVKSAAYVQSWKQNAPSIISFDISTKFSWDAETALTSTEARRSADCFVFCLYAEMDLTKVNILDVTHWLFFVVLTEQLNQVFGNQKSVRLSGIQRLCDSVSYYNLKEKVEQVLELTD